MTITLLDGGLGQELVHRSGDQPTPLWSTQVMLDRPGLVAEVHRDFIASGATVVTANTYAIHRDRLVMAGSEAEYEALHARAQEELTAACAGHPNVRKAASIGPLVASYRPDLHPEHDKAVALYAEVARQHADWADLVICETVPSLTHADAILDGAAVAGKPVWIGFTIDDEDGTKLRSGESVSDALIMTEGRAEAILINCSAPEAIPPALDALSAGSLPFGAYANAFTMITKDFLKEAPTVDALTKRRDMTPETYADHVMGWVDQGATIVGGCCEVSPAHIQTIRDRLLAAGHTII